MKKKTAQQIIWESMPEEELQNQIIEYAHLIGYDKIAHFRGVRIQREDGSYYYATPVGADGEGFPDLVLVSTTKKRIVFIETKKQKGKRKPKQVEWAIVLEAAKAEYYCVKPSDWDYIKEILK